MNEELVSAVTGVETHVGDRWVLNAHGLAEFFGQVADGDLDAPVVIECQDAEFYIDSASLETNTETGETRIRLIANLRKP